MHQWPRGLQGKRDWRPKRIFRLRGRVRVIRLVRRIFLAVFNNSDETAGDVRSATSDEALADKRAWLVHATSRTTKGRATADGRLASTIWLSVQVFSLDEGFPFQLRVAPSKSALIAVGQSVRESLKHHAISTWRQRFRTLWQCRRVVECDNLGPAVEGHKQLV